MALLQVFVANQMARISPFTSTSSDNLLEKSYVIWYNHYVYDV